MRIVFAIDGSARSLRGVDYLARHRAQFIDGHELILVHVCPRVPSHAARHLPRGAVARYYQEEAAKALQPVEEALARAGIAGWRTDCRHGRAAEQVLDAANAVGAEMIVVGLRDVVIFGRPLPGSIGARIAAMTKQVAVLLVP